MLQHPGWLAAKPPDVPPDNPAILWKLLCAAWKKPKFSAIIIPPPAKLQPLPAAPEIPPTTSAEPSTPSGTTQTPSVAPAKIQTAEEEQEEQDRQVQEILTGSVINAWSNVFAWDMSTSAAGGAPGLKLKNNRPTLLLDRFEQLYMSAPMIAQDVA